MGVYDESRIEHDALQNKSEGDFLDNNKTASSCGHPS
jgi:hypothetical protein